MSGSEYMSEFWIKRTFDGIFKKKSPKAKLPIIDPRTFRSEKRWDELVDELLKEAEDILKTG